MMAIPIKETPVISGDDARRFVENMRAKREKLPPVDYERVLEKVAEKAAQSGKKYM
jgi:hypothetical protein